MKKNVKAFKMCTQPVIRVGLIVRWIMVHVEVCIFAQHTRNNIIYSI